MIGPWESEGGAVTGASELLDLPSASREERWYAVHTRARHEKKVARQLEQKGIAVFLPTIREAHRWSDRQKVVEVPLFSCYVFVKVPGWRCAQSQVLRTAGLLRWVGVNGEPAAIPDSQIDAVRLTLENGLVASPHPFLKLGQRVRIRGGCLDGIEGILTGANGDRRLVVSVDLIQQSVAVALQGYEVVPA